jgi:hypothetical protein
LAARGDENYGTFLSSFVSHGEANAGRAVEHNDAFVLQIHLAVPSNSAKSGDDAPLPQCIFTLKLSEE